MANLVLDLKPTNFDGELSGTSLDISRISKNYLLGRIISGKFFGLGYIKSTLKKVWGCKGNLEVTGKGSNIFLFQFEKEEDKLGVVAGTPWFFSNCHIVVKEWLPHMAWEHVELGKSCMWIQVHGLPLQFMNEENALAIGNSFGGLLDSDMSLERILAPESFIRLKVALWIDRPLPTGFTMAECWVRFKYEQLPECCWFCGRLGHSMTRCPFKGPNDRPAVFDIPEKGFGPWLRANAVMDLSFPEYAPAEKHTVKRKRETPGTSKNKIIKNPKGKKAWVPVDKPLTIGSPIQAHGGENPADKAGIRVEPATSEKSRNLSDIEHMPVGSMNSNCTLGILAAPFDAHAAGTVPDKVAESVDKIVVGPSIPIMDSCEDKEYEPPVVFSPATRQARSTGLSGSDSDGPFDRSPMVNASDEYPEWAHELVLAQERLEEQKELEKAIQARQVPVLVAPPARKWKRSARLRGLEPGMEVPFTESAAVDVNNDIMVNVPIVECRHNKVCAMKKAPVACHKPRRAP
ncbi:hypothetical protein Tsubulata_045426 [Turnera subulata]|uniref:CCHC-type domain-containing protein n=1 Tax=Turnera subulata TaxID=218843 RepID=A0A9Q0F118_9ROSI|nr:hypothetical protein Tsubulata_045426 [Turnera subulata]